MIVIFKQRIALLLVLATVTSTGVTTTKVEGAEFHYEGATKVIAESLTKAEKIAEKRLQKRLLKLEKKKKKLKEEKRKKELWETKEKQHGYTSAVLNIRKKATTDSNVIGVYPFNISIEYVRYNDDWNMVKYGDKLGFVSNQYISDKKCVSGYNQNEIALLKRCVQAEVGYHEPDYGVRLVVDVIINRVKSKKFPNSVTGVITQPYQFSSYWDGNMRSVKGISEQVNRIVEEEIIRQTNGKVMYFTAGQYNSHCVPMGVVGHHYFGY